jgi:putative endonuclease
MPPVMKEHIYYVYIMTNASRRSLYTGVCSRLRKRTWEHKAGIFDGFTKQYRVTRLVYYERFHRIGNAIAREKQIKRWRREKKVKTHRIDESRLERLVRRMVR